MNLLSIVPWYYRALALVLLVASLIGFGWVKGANHVQDKWDAQKQEIIIKTITIQAEQAKATVKTIIKYVDRVKVIHEKGKTIYEQVPVYITPEADAACVVPVGFIRLLSDAADVPDIPRATNNIDDPFKEIRIFALTGSWRIE